MRDRDLNRVRDHVLWHMEKKRRDAVKGNKISWSYIRFAAWALPLLREVGAFSDGDAPVVAGSNREDAG